METRVRVTATANAWDAPVTVVRRADGSVRMLRKWADPRPGETHTHFPHAVVHVDGELSEFDAARQP